MRVWELIAVLSKLDPNLVVVRKEGEHYDLTTGFDPVTGFVDKEDDPFSFHERPTQRDVIPAVCLE